MGFSNELTIEHMQLARVSRDKRFDGLFFVGVLSTGIFCRPICPVKLAKEDNVRYYKNAFSAIAAGYRPCKVCRPDSAPANRQTWQHDITLNKACQLIQNDLHLSIKHLAKRLGISIRRLEQVFNQQLGLTPSQFQKSARLLFAKQLLQQTSLSIVDVANASGFESSRGLQRIFSKQFNMTPTSLRKNTALLAEVDTELFLSFRPPYQWTALRDFLHKRCLPEVEEITENSYQRYFSVEGEAGYVKATFNQAKQGFDVTLSVPNPKYIRPILTNLSRVLDCDANWLCIGKVLQYAGLKVDDNISGLRIPGTWSVFEAGCRAILGQQVSVAGAISKTKELIAAIRKHHSGVGFPEPGEFSASIINSLGMPQSRKQTLLAFAEYMTSKERIKQVEQGDMTGLLDIKGIGPWTCQYIQLRGNSHPDIWMESDLVIKNQCAKHSLSPAQVKPWGSYLTIALWHTY